MLNDEIQLIVKMLLNKYPQIEKMEFLQLKYERIYCFKCSNNIKCFLLVKDSLIENYIAIFVKNGNYKANLNFPNKIYISNDLLIKSEEYYENNKFKYEIMYNYYSKGKLKNKLYFNEIDQFHRLDGPAFISYSPTGKVIKRKFFLNDEMYDELSYEVKIACEKLN
jgi:hypothetical protein